MKLSQMKTAVTRGVGSKVLAAKRNSPHFFFVGGVVGVAGSTYLACRATLKLNETLDEIQADIQKVKDTKIFADEAKEGLYPEDNYQRDLVLVHVKAAGKVVKLYGPSIVLGVASVGALTGSHVQLSRRNSALTAALVAVQKAYDEYRSRVREQLGEERELDIYHGATIEMVKGDDGKAKKIKVVDSNKMSPYAKWFDEASSYWEKDAEMNRIRVECNQRYANQILHARGHLFLNEVYKMFDIPTTQAGNVVGWRIGDEGDNYIDFGTFEAASSEFVNNREPRILLDFNVDGPIIDYLDKY